MKLYLTAGAIGAGIAILAFIAGSYRETRVDGRGGWCVHFNRLMVCNTRAVTDYVLGEAN